MPFPRAAGIILHPTSLPGSHGIGDLGPAAYRFIDFLHASGLTLWQVLPLGPTGASNSPYQSLSSFAGNSMLVALEPLVNDGLLKAEDLQGVHFAEGRVDYCRAAEFKERALRKAFAVFQAGRGNPALRSRWLAFKREQAAWLEDFACFAALRRHFQNRAWFAWPDKGLVKRSPALLAKVRKEMADEIAFQVFCQFCFFSQWRALKDYANQKGICIIGDVPIYVAHDSADVWASPEIFALDESGLPLTMAGVPPDYFSATGQLWGNPLYRWDALAESGFSWWLARISATLALVDRLRIDHFRGFESYWEVPAGETTAVNGRWRKGPGDAFFNALRNSLGELPIIAEDLGVITPEVTALRQRHGLPGMKILQFAFCDGAEHYLPHTYESNCVCYTATHDNDTTRGWYAAEGADYSHHDRAVIERERDKARRYLARDGSDIAWDFIRLAMSSVADTAIFPMQDVLNLGNEARMNRPGIAEGQWEWRMTAEQLANAPAGRLREMVWLYGRG